MPVTRTDRTRNDRTRKICVVMPAYNAERTLERTCARPAHGLGRRRSCWSTTLSRDRTVEVARGLGLHVLVHPQNRGYGGNQKTCYREALAARRRHRGHGPSRPSVRPEDHPRARGAAARRRLRRRLRQPHAGRPAARGRDAEVEVPRQPLPDRRGQRHLLRLPLRVPLRAAGLLAGATWRPWTWRATRTTSCSTRRSSRRACGKICAFREIPIQTRYFPEASQIGFWRSVRYGLSVLGVMARYKMQKKGLIASRIFADPPAAPAASTQHSPSSR